MLHFVGVVLCSVIDNTRFESKAMFCRIPETNVYYQLLSICASE